MAGIYLHIPFCKQACHYCDFHFSTNLSYRKAMVNALVEEIEFRKQYLSGGMISTIYFGGGTPSLLTDHEITAILSKIFDCFDVEKGAEITLEANPDDLSQPKLKALQQAGINRLSIGIQSFDDSALSLMNRAHCANEAITAVKSAQDIGISNISIDLMYGLPNSDLNSWERALETADKLKVPHISAYCLTIEQQTFFEHLRRKNELSLPDEEIIASQFEMMISFLKDRNYLHYEVSNFCLPGQFAVHNSNYWKMKKYLGIGPSAHSYDLVSRQFNVKNNHTYMQGITNGKLKVEKESLSIIDQANDYLLTSLRTIWGCNLTIMLDKFGIDLNLRHPNIISDYIEKQLLEKKNDTITLTAAGMLLADQITSSLFLET